MVALFRGKDKFLWVDYFSLRQHKGGGAFEPKLVVETVRQIGCVVASLPEDVDRAFATNGRRKKSSDGENDSLVGCSLYLQRSFCLLEVFAAAASGALLRTDLNDDVELEYRCSGDGVDVARAGTHSPAEKRAIDAFICETLRRAAPADDDDDEGASSAGRGRTASQHGADPANQPAEEGGAEWNRALDRFNATVHDALCSRT